MLTAKAVDAAQQVRRIIPARSLPGLISRRLDRLWGNDDFRLAQEDQMHCLLDTTERAAEVPDLARGYAENTMLRAYLRWHPGVIARQPLRDVEWLTTRRDPSRSIVLSFMHHNRYDGMFASLSRAGAPCHVLTLPDVLTSGTPSGLKQHIRNVGRGGTIVPASGGTDEIAGKLRPGVTMAIATDVPGRTPVTFLGREVLGSFGAARIATMTNSQVVIATAWRDDAGSHVQIDAPIEPSDFADPRDLLEAMLSRHAEAVLAWPEAVDTPTARWGKLEA